MTPSNLLKNPWTVSRLEALLKRHPRQPLLPSLDAPEWARVATSPLARRLVAPLRVRAEAECGRPLPALTDTLYASLRLTKVRLTFENVYFERRRRLARAAISLLLSLPDDPWRKRLSRSLTKKLESVFDEVSWALPAHVNLKTDDISGKDPLHIDLFCAETANLMAEALDLFGSILPAALRERIRVRLERDIFRNFVDNYAQLHWRNGTSNWNAVCYQGVVGAALSQLDDPRLCARMLMLARKGLPCFLGGFTRDGGCTEGVGYWSYGFGWFSRLNAQLETRTGGALSLFVGDTHVHRIVNFGPAMVLADGKTVNFADSGAEGNLPSALFAYLGKRWDDVDCARAAREGYRFLARDGIDADAERCDLPNLHRLFLNVPGGVPASVPTLPDDRFLPDLQVVVARGRDRRGHLWELAAKGGHNGEHHNHNDCGSWLLNIDGARLVAEIGAPEYVWDSFDSKRYEFLAMRSRGHSLPVINGQEQAAGKEFCSKVLFCHLTPARAKFVVDATDTYPQEAGCRRFVRTLQLDKKAGRLVVRDTFRIAAPFQLEGALISLRPIRIAREGSHAVIRVGKLALEIRPDPGTRLARVETHPFRTHEGEDAVAYRLALVPIALKVNSRLGVVLTLSS